LASIVLRWIFSRSSSTASQCLSLSSESTNIGYCGWGGGPACRIFNKIHYLKTLRNFA
jgi:hypothetical protein